MLGKENNISYESECNELINILAPKFEVFSNLMDKIDDFNRSTEVVFNQEQKRILMETVENRNIFFGGAGTGKTFIALEKAKQSALQGKKVLLTCYTKKLPESLFKPMLESGNIKENKIYKEKITCINFHDFIIDLIKKDPVAAYEFDQKLKEYKSSDNIQIFYNIYIPEKAMELTLLLTEDSEKFDVIIIDEGQDFMPEWIECLDLLLKENNGNSLFYIFADENQNIFHRDLDKFKNFKIHKRKLVMNMRNSEAVFDFMQKINSNQNMFSHDTIPKCPAVNIFNWSSYEEEIKIIEKEIKRLVHQKVSLSRIVLLSPNVYKYSSLKNTKTLAGYKISENIKIMSNKENNKNDELIKFQTIRSFKGLESDIVFLIDLRENNLVCNKHDIYVGASRAKYLLNIFKAQDFEIIP